MHLRLHTFIPLLCIAAALAGTAGFRYWIDQRKVAAQTADAVELSPGINLAMIALSGARGILSEILWHHANNLQREDRYIELVPLAEWITRLDPRASKAWMYQAWNLAYNVSVMMPDGEDRWPWVQRGIDLLKEGVLKWNPGDPALCRELSWTYDYKIGGYHDSAHLYYKCRLAAIAAPHVDTNGHRTPASANWFKSQGFRLETLDAAESQLGKFDWRVPESYAFYWALETIRNAEPHHDVPAVFYEYMMADNALNRLLITLIERGHFAGNLQTGEWKTAPNFDFLSAFLSRHATYEEQFGQEDLKVVYARLARLARENGRLDLAVQIEARIAAFKNI